MEINRFVEGNISFLSLSGNLLGEKDAAPILDIVLTSIENKNNRFVVDLSELKYINSTGLTVLLTILTKSRNSGGEMVLTNIPDQLNNLLTITKLADVFPKAKSKEEALNYLN